MVKSHQTHHTLCMTGAPSHSTPRNSWLRVAEDPIMDRSPGKPGPRMVDAPKSLRMHKRNLGDFGDFKNDIYIQIILNIDPVVLNSSKHHLLNATLPALQRYTFSSAVNITQALPPSLCRAGRDTGQSSCPVGQARTGGESTDVCFSLQLEFCS